MQSYNKKLSSLYLSEQTGKMLGIENSSRAIVDGLPVTVQYVTAVSKEFNIPLIVLKAEIYLNALRSGKVDENYNYFSNYYENISRIVEFNSRYTSPNIKLNNDLEKKGFDSVSRFKYAVASSTKDFDKTSQKNKIAKVNNINQKLATIEGQIDSLKEKYDLKFRLAVEKSDITALTVMQEDREARYALLSQIHNLEFAKRMILEDLYKLVGNELVDYEGTQKELASKIQVIEEKLAETDPSMSSKINAMKNQIKTIIFELQKNKVESNVAKTPVSEEEFKSLLFKCGTLLQK